jgi:hypothetical protein
MLEFLGESANARNVRLFACAVGRLLPCLSSRSEYQEREVAIVVAERFADGLVTPTELKRAAPCSSGLGVRSVCLASALEAASYSAKATQVRSGVKAGLLRCIFGNPFKPIALKSAWLTADVVNLARAAYEERIMPRGELNSDRLKVLADGLEEAGCTSAEVLGHLRGPGPHVRGCFTGAMPGGAVSEDSDFTDHRTGAAAEDQAGLGWLKESVGPSSATAGGA